MRQVIMVIITICMMINTIANHESRSDTKSSSSYSYEETSGKSSDNTAAETKKQQEKEDSSEEEIRTASTEEETFIVGTETFAAEAETSAPETEPETEAEEEQGMYLIMTIEGEEHKFWQQTTKISEKGGTVGSFIAFDENGEKIYEATLVLDDSIETGYYSKASDGGDSLDSDCMFSLRLKSAPGFELRNSYMFGSQKNKSLWAYNSFHLVVETADILHRHYSGTFEGMMSPYKGSRQIKITNGSFDMLYGGVSPYYESSGRPVSRDTTAASSPTTETADSGWDVRDDVCSRCGGLGGCDNCWGNRTVRCTSGKCSNGTCTECGGDGQIEVYGYGSSGSHIKHRRCTYCNYGLCKRCNGTGELLCKTCGGTGRCPRCGK